MFQRLISFINKHNISHNKQFRFRAKQCTSNAVLSIPDKIQRAVKNGYY